MQAGKRKVFNMKKINLGYEKYDSSTGFGWNFNGRVESSTTAMTDDQLHNTNQFIRDLHNALVTPEKVLDESKYLQFSLFNSINNLLIDRRQVDEISEFYFYPIIIGNMQLYRHNSHISISKKVRNDVTNRQAMIVFVYHLEGDIKYELNSIERLVRDLNVPKESVLLIHGDYNVEKYMNMPFMYEPVNPFPYWINDRPTQIIEYRPKYLALCYNRAIRMHRIWLLSKLYKAQLLDDLNYSLGSTRATNPNLSLRDYIVEHNAGHYHNTITEEEIEFLVRCENKSTDQLDLINNNPAQMVVFNDYETSFVSLITETLSESDIVFLSEKIYKPIAVGHPFIVLGSPKILHTLRQLGFKTFGDFWDESYDNEENLSARMDMIISILNDLKKKSVNELVTMRNAMVDILKHNQKLLNEKYPIDSEFRDRTEIKDILLRYTERKQ
jgi:hypothetical protein